MTDIIIFMIILLLIFIIIVPTVFFFFTGTFRPNFNIITLYGYDRHHLYYYFICIIIIIITIIVLQRPMNKIVAMYIPKIVSMFYIQIVFPKQR